MPTLAYEELREILLGKRGCHIVTLITNTQPEMVAWIGERPTKKNPDADGVRNPFYGRVWKHAKVNGAIGFWYDRGVNRRRIKEDKVPDFVALDHAYHEHIPGCPLVYHRDNPERLYLPILDPRSLGYTYYVDDVETPNDVIEPWIRQKVEGARQGLDNPRRYREYKLESIQAIIAWHDSFVIEHDNVRAGV